MAGFSGSSCERLDCKDQCNDRGICYTMRDFAGRTRYTFFTTHFLKLQSTSLLLLVYFRNELSQQFTYTSRWDHDMIKGCQCDYPATGYDCSQSLCPNGDDPLTTGQVRPNPHFPSFFLFPMCDQWLFLFIIGERSSIDSLCFHSRQLRAVLQVRMFKFIFYMSHPNT